MRNRQSVLWWILGIYLIFSVTSATLGQAVPSEADTPSNDSGADTVSDDPVLSQPQVTQIMDKIHEVETRLRTHIDEKYSEAIKDSATLRQVASEIRDHIDQRYSELNTEISMISGVEDRLRDHIDRKYSALNTEIATLSKDVEALKIGINGLQLKLDNLLYLTGAILFCVIIPLLISGFRWAWEHRNPGRTRGQVQSAADFNRS